MNFRDLNISIRKSRIPEGYYAVDIRIRIDGVEKEMNELLPVNDFHSRWKQLLNLVDREVMEIVTEYEKEEI